MSIGMLENANENTQKNLIQEKNSTTKSVGLEKGVYREDATSEDRGTLDELNKKWLSDEYTPKKWEEKHKEAKERGNVGFTHNP